MRKLCLLSTLLFSCAPLAAVLVGYSSSDEEMIDSSDDEARPFHTTNAGPTSLPDEYAPAFKTVSILVLMPRLSKSLTCLQQLRFKAPWQLATLCNRAFNSYESMISDIKRVLKDIEQNNPSLQPSVQKVLATEYCLYTLVNALIRK